MIIFENIPSIIDRELSMSLSLSIPINNTFSFSLSYSAIYQPLGDESIEAPDGPVYEILKLNLNDLYNLLDDIKENIHGTIIGQLFGI